MSPTKDANNTAEVKLDHPSRSIKLRWANGLENGVPEPQSNHLRSCRHCRGIMAKMVDEKIDDFNKRLALKRM